jgi:hypothetical protein
MLATILLCAALFAAELNEGGVDPAQPQFQAKVGSPKTNAPMVPNQAF